MKTRISWVVSVAVTAAVAHAASFYGAIRITNAGIPGSDVVLSTGVIDFQPPVGPTNGQAIVSIVNPGPGPDPGPSTGSTVQVKDLIPGSPVTNFLTSSTWTGPFSNGGFIPPGFFVFPLLPPPPPPFLVGPAGCAPAPFPFCVKDNLGSGSVVFFGLGGAASGQLGFWDASFAAWVPQTSTDVQALLAGGQTVVSPVWFADLFAAPEPATSITIVTSVCLLALVLFRFKPGSGSLEAR